VEDERAAPSVPLLLQQLLQLRCETKGKCAGVAAFRLARVEPDQLVQQRRFPEALATLPEAVDLQAGHLGGGSRGYTHGMAGHSEEALAIERRLGRRGSDLRTSAPKCALPAARRDDWAHIPRDSTR